MFALARCGDAAARLVVGRSRFGHGLRSLRENEEAAETLGVPVVRYKLLAFVLSAAIPGMVGAVMALRSTYFVVGQVFDPMISVTVIAMALLGGGDDARGPLLGALFLVLLSELLWAHAPLALHDHPRRHPDRASCCSRPTASLGFLDGARAPRRAAPHERCRQRAAARGPRPRQALRRPDRALRTSRSTVAAGEIVGVMGANGAGKTTLFSLIAGNARPTRGRHPLRGPIASSASGPTGSAASASPAPSRSSSRSRR